MNSDAVHLRMRHIAEIAIMLDAAIFYFYGIVPSNLMRTLMWISFILSSAFAVCYSFCDFVWFKKLKDSRCYNVVLIFCGLSVLSLCLNFSMDYRARIIISTAVSLFMFYLFPRDVTVRSEVDFVFGVAHVILYFFVTLLFALTVGVFLIGPYSILGASYRFVGGRLNCGLYPNIIGTVALAAIISSVYRILILKRCIASSAVLIGFSIILLLLAQTKTATYSLIAFCSIFTFYIAFTKLRRISNSVIRIILALLGMVACAIFLLLLFAALYNLAMIVGIACGAVQSKPVQRITSSVDWTFTSRTSIWLEAIEYIVDSPYFGVDTDVISESTVLSVQPHVHNQLLQIALGSGVLCAFLAVFVVAYYVIGFLRRSFFYKSIAEIFCFAVIVAVTIELMFETLFSSLLLVFYFTSLGYGTNLISRKSSNR